MTLKNGETANVDEVLNLVGTNFKNQAQLLYNSAYIGFNSKLNVATGVPNLKNVKYDACLSDTATTSSGIYYNSTDKLYNTLLASDYGGVYMIIEATSLSTPISLNNCVSVAIGTGRWLVYCTTGTAEVRRAQIIKTLFYGSNGADAKINTFTSVTAIKTNISRDVGKKATLGLFSASLSSSTSPKTYTGTFSDISTNSDCSTWGYCSMYIDNSGTLATSDLSIGGSSVCQIQHSNSGQTKVTDDTGTNTQSEEKNNPSTIIFSATASSGSANCSSIIRAIILHTGTLSWSGAGGSSNTFPVAFTSVISDVSLIFQTTSLPTITDCIPTWNSLIDPDNTLTVSISADGTHYEEVTDATIHRFTNTGTNLFIKFEIDRVDTAAVDKISEYAVLYNVGAS